VESKKLRDILDILMIFGVHWGVL